jgi:serine/threonine-protein kinase
MAAMSACPACASPLAPGSRYWGVRAAARGAVVGAPTEHSPHQPSGVVRAAATETRFLPGTLLAERYRIVGPLGKGGMGEVYRADDLKLGQPVALKFLPPGFERDADRLQRFLAEVRTARQVSHANVCRVYDAGEAGGQHFLSMEFVDGEDLSSLLRRIGRVPRDKAVQIARQLCAGLAAAHESGVLHRDLKPANVMIDGRGRARITDFGWPPWPRT